MTTIVSLESFLGHHCAGIPLGNELQRLLLTLASVGTELAEALANCETAGITGKAGTTNVSGDDVAALDLFADKLVAERLKRSGLVACFGSEERDELNFCRDDAPLAVFYDPLDGSSNIDAQIPTGMIFSVYRSEDVSRKAIAPGNRQIAAGYILFSSAVNLVASVGGAVFQATLDQFKRRWVITKNTITSPKKAKIYSFNEANCDRWHGNILTVVNGYRACDNLQGEPFTARYIGSLVADAHRNLLYGGVFGYPGDSINPKGKLRLLYECNPLAWLYEKAGGRGSNGTQSVLDVAPESLHQRMPFFLGPQAEIERLETMLRGETV